jgi:site-specific recombinase XerD
VFFKHFVLKKKAAMPNTLRAPYATTFDEFLSFKKRRVSAQGYSSLKKNVRVVLFWFQAHKILLENATIEDALKFRQAECNRKKANGLLITTGTVHNRLKAARSPFRFLVNTEQRKTNPFDETTYPKMPEYLSRNILNEEQMGLLLEKLARFDEEPTRQLRIRRYRCHVASEFLYATGMRIAEVASLKKSNVDVVHRLVYVPYGKGGKGRVAFLTGYSADVMKKYFTKGRKAVLGTHKRVSSTTVFGVHPQRLMALINTELREVCKTLDIPVITTHGFRHSLGTHLLQQGCDMRHIQGILGHASLQSTQIYTRVNTDEIRQVLDKYHPRRLEK